MNSTTRFSGYHIPKSVTKTSRVEDDWLLEVRQQKNKVKEELIPLSELPLAELPLGLHGYVFIVGALFQAQDRPQEDGTQLYTGDGMVYRLGFEAGKANLQTRIAKTPCYYADPSTQFYLGSNSPTTAPSPSQQKESSRFVKKYTLFSYLAAFRNGGQSRFSFLLGARNQLNTAFAKTRDHLLLTIDAGRPYQLDPNTMELLEPAGSTQEWFSIFPVVFRLSWIKMFEVYINSAHTVTDFTNLKGGQDELFTTNYSTGYNGVFEKPVNCILDGFHFRSAIKLIYALTKKRFDIKREFGRFTYLVRYQFEDKQKKVKPLMQRWHLILPDGKPLLVNQSLHQLAITAKYIILADITFKMEFSQIFSPFIFGFLKLPAFRKVPFWGSLVQAVFLRPVKPLPFANLYIVKREDLDDNQEDTTENIPEKIPEIEVQVVRLPREISHFAADYSNPNNQITLHVGHNNGWDVTECITEYDTPVPGKVLRKDLAGMMVGSTDLGSLGKYVVDGESGKILSSKTVQDPQSTWALSIYTHRDLNRDSLAETAQKVKNIYWLSLGFAWELIPQRIYDAYKADPCRVISVEELPNDNKPLTLLRLDTERMEIADSYSFPSGTYVSSIQFVPSSLPCPEDVDESIHGFIVCAVMLDPLDSSLSNFAGDEFWVFHGNDLTGNPIYRLSVQAYKDQTHKPFNHAMTIHSTWLAELPSPPSKDERCRRRQESVEKDYAHLVRNKRGITGPVVRELFDKIVFPNFIDQTLEKDFEQELLPKDEESRDDICKV